MSSIPNTEEIRIINVRAIVKKQLTNIAKHEEMQLGPFLRKKFTEILDSYPADKRNNPPID